MKRWIGGTAAVWPDRSWQVYALPRVPEVFRRVRAAVAEVAGDPPGSGWPGHISLGYAREDRDSGEIQSPLRRQRSGPIRGDWTVSALYLCDVKQDPIAHTYTWRTALKIPLGTARHPV